MNQLRNIEIEDKIIGLIIKKPALSIKLLGRLKAKDFSKLENQIIYEELNNFFTESKEVITWELIKRIKEKSSNFSAKHWDTYIAEIVIKSGIEPQLESYLKVLLETSKLREFDAILRQYLKLLNSESQTVEFDELLNTIDGELLDLAKTTKNSNFHSIGELSEELAKKITQYKEDGYDYGVKTNLNNLHNIIGGFKPGELTIIAARPSMGKTALALEIARQVGKKQMVAFFSVEMHPEQLTQRMVFAEALLEQKSIQKLNNLSQPENERLNQSFVRMRDLQIYIEQPNSIIEEIVWSAKSLNLRKKIDLIIVDYLQLLNTSKNMGNRVQEVSHISRALKLLATDLGVPVIAISQLSRGVESRENKKPQMSDLRDSGSIEQDADSILMLYREEYYKSFAKNSGSNSSNQEEKVFSQSNLSNVEELQVLVKKNRNGPTGTATLEFDLSKGRITNKIFNR